MLEIISPAVLNNRVTVNQQGQASLVDDAAPSPLGLLILQNSYLDDEAANEDFVIFHYYLTNTSEETLTNIYAGLFFDWDINTDAQDFARFDDTRRLGYVLNRSVNPDVLVGTRVLSAGPMTYHAIDNPTEIYGGAGTDGGFRESEKWSFLSGGIQRTTLANTDVSQMTGTGPFVLDPGATVEIAFAVVAGTSETDLQDNADAAAALWGDIVRTSTEDAPGAPPATFRLEAPFPNPAAFPATISYQLGAPSHVTMRVYDVLGRLVQTLAHGQARSAGTHRLGWDGTDQSGQRLAGGIYFVQMTATGQGTSFSQTRQIVVVR